MGATGLIRLIVLGALLVFAIGAQQSSASMQMLDQSESVARTAASQPTATLAIVENPELVARVLESLLRSIIYSASSDLQIPK